MDNADYVRQLQGQAPKRAAAAAGPRPADELAAAAAGAVGAAVIGAAAGVDCQSNGQRCTQGCQEAIGAPPDCPICFDSTSADDSLALSCNHVLHGSCLATFLQGPEEALCKATNQYCCPVCKADTLKGREAAQQQQQVGPGQHQQQQGSTGYVSQQDIEQLVALGALTAEQEEKITRQQIRRAVGAGYSCINSKCNVLLLVEPGPGAADSAYCVTCGNSNTVQCCSCGVKWGPEHKGLTCKQFKARQAGGVQAADAETQRLLRQAVACPGSCQQAAGKPAGDDSCNVMCCTKCKLYYCYLCGIKIASSSWDPQDRRHREANQHFLVPGTPCYGALWAVKEQWQQLQQLQQRIQAVRQQAQLVQQEKVKCGAGQAEMYPPGTKHLTALLERDAQLQQQLAGMELQAQQLRLEVKKAMLPAAQQRPLRPALLPQPPPLRPPQQQQQQQVRSAFSTFGFKVQPSERTMVHLNAPDFPALPSGRIDTASLCLQRDSSLCRFAATHFELLYHHAVWASPCPRSLSMLHQAPYLAHSRYIICCSLDV